MARDQREDQGYTRREFLAAGTAGFAALLLAACRYSRPEAAPVPAPAPAPPSGMWYTAGPGDTLPGLARRSGLDVARILAANPPGLRANGLRSGDRVFLPGVSSLPAAPPPGPAPQPNAPYAPAGDGRFTLVPRSAWTKEPVGPNHVLMDGVKRIVVHHTDEHAGMDGLSDLEVVRRIENYHRGPEKRWAAIGYHFLIGKDGKVYEGRPLKYQGAHVSENNPHSIGVSVIGDCHRHLPNQRQMAALESILDELCARYDVPRAQVYGHRDLKPTVCPGDMLYAWVAKYRKN